MYRGGFGEKKEKIKSLKKKKKLPGRLSEVTKDRHLAQASFTLCQQQTPVDSLFELPNITLGENSSKIHFLNRDKPGI